MIDPSDMIRTEVASVVCSACGKIFGEHSFDSSCRTWATLVYRRSVVRNGLYGTASRAQAVPNAPSGHELMRIVEAAP